MLIVPQLNPEMSTSQIVNTISSFKTKILNKKNQVSKLIQADSLGLDSATFVLESALNYDFDTQKDEEIAMEVDTIIQVIPINSNSRRVNSNDLEDIYSNLSTAIASFNNSHQVNVFSIDVTGLVYNPGTNQAVFELVIQRFNILIPRPCNVPFNTVYASCTAITNATCPQSLVDAGVKFNQSTSACIRWRCQTGDRFFWSHIGVMPNYIINGLQNSTVTYDSGFATLNTWCNNSAVNTMGASQLNGYINQAANLSITQAPAQYAAYQRFVTGTTISTNNTIKCYWTLYIKWAKPNCLTTSPQ